MYSDPASMIYGAGVLINTSTSVFSLRAYHLANTIYSSSVHYALERPHLLLDACILQPSSVHGNRKLGVIVQLLYIHG